MVVAMVVLLALIPTSVSLVAQNQIPMGAQTALSQEALQAARAGLSDYVNWAQANANYPLDYCSSEFCSSESADTTNDAFANTALATASWVLTQGSTTASNVAYQYLVDSAGLTSAAPGDFTVYSTGRAGATSHYVYQTVRAILQYVPSGGGGPCPTSPFTVEVPPSIAYLSITVAGAQGGGSSADDPGGGGDGTLESATIPLSSWSAPRLLTFMPGQPGYGGDYALLGLDGQGGSGGCGAAELDGGNGGGAGLAVSVQTGGGGGAGSTLCYGSESQCTTGSPSLCASATSSPPCLLVVGGGGGGDGGENALLAAGGLGAWYCTSTGSNCNISTNWTSTGGSGSNLLGLGHASGGTMGGTSTSLGADGAGTWLVGLLEGLGGGGGGGYSDGGAGGQEGGILGLVGGSGGGGGPGDAAAVSWACAGTVTTPTYESTYPSSDTTGAGIVEVTGDSGSSCSSLTAVKTWIDAVAVVQMDPNASDQ